MNNPNLSHFVILKIYRRNIFIAAVISFFIVTNSFAQSPADSNQLIPAQKKEKHSPPANQASIEVKQQQEAKYKQEQTRQKEEKKKHRQEELAKKKKKKKHKNEKKKTKRFSKRRIHAAKSGKRKKTSSGPFSGERDPRED